MNAKKFLSVLLSIAMIASMAVVSMAAATTLPPAVDGVIKLTEDVVLTSTYEVADTLTIDLNGHTISGTDTTALYSLIHVKNGANLTIEDSVGTGKISYDAGTGNKTGVAVWVEGALTLESGTIEITGDWIIGFAVDVRPNAWDTAYTKAASFTMNDGKIVASDSGVRVSSNSSDSYPNLGVTFTMNGGTIDSAYDGIFVQNVSYDDTLNVKVVDGTVTSENTHAVRVYGNSNGKVDVKMSITGGNFTGKMTNLDQTGTGEVAISGGTFEVEPLADYLAAGYAVVEKNGAYEVVKETKVEINEESNVDTAVPVVLEKPGEGVVESTDNNTYAGLEDGYYNMTVTDNAGNKMTVLVEVVGGDLVLDEVNSLVEGVGTVVESNVTDYAVGGAAQQAAKLSAKNNNEPVTVTTTIEPSVIDKTDAAQTAISAKSESGNLYFIDITPTYTVNNGAAQPLSKTDVMFKIVIPFEAAAEGTVEVYRYHDGVAEKMEESDGTSEGFEVKNGCVIIYSEKFSTYAIGYSEASGSAVAGGRGIILEGPYLYKPEDDAMMDETEMAREKESLEYGEPVYYLIVDEDLANGPTAGSALNNKKYVEKLKVKAEWTMGGSAVEGVSVVKKYVDLDAANNSCNTIPESGYYYFLEIVTAEKKGIAETDVVGVVEFDRKADSKNGVEKIKDCKIDVDFTLFYPNTWLNDGTISDDRADLEWDTPYVLKFDYDDEVELSFGSASGGNNEGTFTVDVSGQGKIYLEYITDADEAIAAANEGAKMDFLTFKSINGVGVKFNRTGEFRYEMDDAAYAYEVVDGKLAPIAGLEVEDDEFIFNTNILKAYVFSDTELVQPA